MRTASLIASLAAVAALAGCVGVRGSGVKAEETRTVGPFKALTLDGGYQVKLEAGPGVEGDVQLALTGDDNLLPLLKTTVGAEVLTCGSDELMWTNLPLTLEARTGPLEALTVNGSAEGEVVGLSGEKVRLEINGSGQLALSGKVGELVIDISGSGTIDARKLEAESVTVDVAGSGEAKVCASKTLTVDISGSGEVEYYCNPSTVNQDIAGSGKVTKQ